MSLISQINAIEKKISGKILFNESLSTNGLSLIGSALGISKGSLLVALTTSSTNLITINNKDVE